MAPEAVSLRTRKQAAAAGAYLQRAKRTSASKRELFSAHDCLFRDLLVQKHLHKAAKAVDGEAAAHLP